MRAFQYSVFLFQDEQPRCQNTSLFCFNRGIPKKIQTQVPNFAPFYHFGPDPDQIQNSLLKVPRAIIISLILYLDIVFPSNPKYIFRRKQIFGAHFHFLPKYCNNSTFCLVAESHSLATLALFKLELVASVESTFLFRGASSVAMSWFESLQAV